MLGSGQVVVRPTISGMPVLPANIDIYDVMAPSVAGEEPLAEVAALDEAARRGESGVVSSSFLAFGVSGKIRAAVSRLGLAVADGMAVAGNRLQIHLADVSLRQEDREDARSFYLVAIADIERAISALDVRARAAGVTLAERTQIINRKMGHEQTLARTLVKLAKLETGVFEKYQRAAEIFARQKLPVELFEAVSLQMSAVASRLNLTGSDVRQIQDIRVRMLLTKREAVRAVPDGDRMRLLEIEQNALSSAIAALYRYVHSFTGKVEDLFHYLEVAEGSYAMQVQLGNVAYARLHEAIRIGRPREEITALANSVRFIFRDLVQNLQPRRLSMDVTTPINVLRRAFASGRVGELSRSGQPFDVSVDEDTVRNMFRDAGSDARFVNIMLAAKASPRAPFMRGVSRFQARLFEGALDNLPGALNETRNAGVRVEAAAAWRDAGELRQAVNHLMGAADIYRQNSQFRESADCFRDAAALFLEVGDPNLKKDVTAAAQAAVEDYERAFQQEPRLRAIHQPDLEQARDLLARARG